MCSRHLPPPSEQSPLSLEALKLLRAYRRLDIEAIAGLRLPAVVEAEVESALRRFIRNVLEREARSLAFLDEVRAHVPA
jgi:DNA repair protein RecO (recombination protein O)